MPDYDEKEDLMDRLMALGRRKKGLSLDQLHRELPENMLSADDIEDVLERLEGANISVAETDAQLLERASNLALDDEEEEAAVEEDKAEEYLRWTIEGIENIRQHFQTALKTWIALIAEQKKAGGKKSKKLLTIRRKTARLRLEIAQEIKDLKLTERSRQVLIAAIRKVVDEIRKSERAINRAEE